MTKPMHPDYPNQIWISTDISPHQTEFATQHRVPFLASPFPQWNYIGGIVVDTSYGSVLPTEGEVLLVEQWIVEYKRRWLNATFIETMKRYAPYDIDRQANTTFFIKYTDNSWAHRSNSWEIGPFYSPPFANGEGVRRSLADVIEQV